SVNDGSFLASGTTWSSRWMTRRHRELAERSCFGSACRGCGVSGALPVLPHVTIDEAARTADCSVCHVGMTMPGVTFGPISATDMLAAFVVQHAVHSKRGEPAGLTTAG